MRTRAKACLLLLALTCPVFLLATGCEEKDTGSDDSARTAALERSLEAERERSAGLADDFAVAVAIAYACVLVTLGFLALLLRERRWRRAAGRILDNLLGNRHGPPRR